MRKYVWLVLALIFLSCHKDPMLHRGYVAVETFNWNVDEDLNQLNIKLSPSDAPLEAISSLLVHIRVDQIDLENEFINPTIRMDTNEMSPYHGTKIIEKKWIPSLVISATTLEFVRVYVK